MQPRVSLVTLGVRDLARSAAFYERLGFPRMPTDGSPVAFFTLNGTWLSLYGRDALAEDATVPAAGGGFAGITLAHNVGSPAEVDAAVTEAETAGATVVKSPRPTDWGGYSGYFADPDGHLWEVAWNPHFWPGPAAG